MLSTAIHAKSKGDEDKLANALHRLEDEDPVLRLERNPETHQTLLSGMGETHLSIALERLARKFGVEVETEEVKVPYRETITGTAEAEGKLKKQTGGHGQFAIAWLRVEPTERGAGFEFVDAIVGGVIPRQYIPAVEKGIHETIERGGALGYPVVDVKVTVLRRQAPPGRQLGDGVQDRGVTRLQGGAGEGRARSCSSRSASSSSRSPRPARATSWATSTRSAAASRAARPSATARSRSSRWCRRRRSCATRSTCAR